MPSKLLILLFAGCGLTSLGCQTDGPETYPVSGQVSFDGKPLNSGEIVFRAEGSPSFAGRIVGGSYSCLATPGQKRVEIVAIGVAESGSRSGSGEPVVRMEADLPPRYNTLSELAAEITAAGPNEFNFALLP